MEKVTTVILMTMEMVFLMKRKKKMEPILKTLTQMVTESKTERRRKKVQTPMILTQMEMEPRTTTMIFQTTLMKILTQTMMEKETIVILMTMGMVFLMKKK